MEVVSRVEVKGRVTRTRLEVSVVYETFFLHAFAPAKCTGHVWKSIHPRPCLSVERWRTSVGISFTFLDSFVLFFLPLTHLLALARFHPSLAS